MRLQLSVIPYQLQFKFDARTSRGVMQQHQVYYLYLNSTANPAIYGVGECAPLPGLSPEYHLGFGKELQQLILKLNDKLQFDSINNLNSGDYVSILKEYPSLAFAFETAWLDLKNGGRKVIYQNNFTLAEAGIPINGLIWMGDQHFMQAQIEQKLQQGYSCLKLKIGGLDFETELGILKYIRQVAAASDLTIRLDANGGFKSGEALAKLHQLSTFDIHSIEQPIKQGQWESMQELCRQSPIPIALDEELIGIKRPEQKRQLLEAIQPQYIILKPTLVGGLNACAVWIELAENQNIGWWITSALESNIGLNAISQFTANYNIGLEQGLGTGQLYHNNIASPLTIQGGYLFYNQNKVWDNNLFEN